MKNSLLLWGTTLWENDKKFQLFSISFSWRTTFWEYDKKTSTLLNDFLSNITNLGIQQYIEGKPVSQNRSDPLMKIIGCILE